MKKHAILGAILSLGIGFFIANNTHAYAQLEYTPNGYTANMVRFNMAEVDLSSNTVLPLISELTSNGTNLNITGSPWFVDTPWYAGIGAVEGNYLVVHGEYKVAWYDYGGSAGEEYFDTARNTMTQNNLKCAAGDSLSQYDGTHTPQITNYSVRVETIGGSLAPQGRPVYKVIVSFDYLQQLSSKKTGGNVFCSWTRNPSDGLLYQALNLSNSHRVYLGYDNTGTTATLKSSLTDALLQQQIYLQQQIIIQDQDDRNNLQGQQGSNEQQANTAGNQARNTGTTLYAAFTQLVTALGSVNGNSCVLPNMSVYSLSFDNMDLCTFDIPPQIMALVSIGMVFIIVPLGINLVKRMISLYKEIIG